VPESLVYKAALIEVIMMKEDIEKLLKHYQTQLKHVLDEYEFKICDVCLLPHDGDGCVVCPRCDGCGETVEQLYTAPNGDGWCNGCMESMHDIDDLMREYNQSR
tara:strand:- start:49 stop:360 length:312 start_codon:yes stop_codon:yes gene_type:complete